MTISQFIQQNKAEGEELAFLVNGSILYDSFYSHCSSQT